MNAVAIKANTAAMATYRRTLGVNLRIGITEGKTRLRMFLFQDSNKRAGTGSVPQNHILTWRRASVVGERENMQNAGLTPFRTVCGGILLGALFNNMGHLYRVEQYGSCENQLTMKTLWRRNLLIVCLVVLAAATCLTVARYKRVVPAPGPGTKLSSAPEDPFPKSTFMITNLEAAIAAQKRESHRRIKERAEDMTEAEKASFEKEFAEKLKPEVARWCSAYAGHIPFQPQDVTMDKLRVVCNLRSDCHAYDFVIDGTTFGVVDDAGRVYVDSLSARGANDLVNIPANPAPPKEGSVSREEILRLIKADSGKDFPPNQINIIPTGRSSAMNGGVAVYVDEGVNANGMRPALAKYSMVFGPDGNLVCYDGGGGL